MTRVSRVVLLALASAAFALGAAMSSSSAQEAPEPPAPRCNEQAPQDFLIRGNFVTKVRQSKEEQAARRALHAKAIRYRTEHYGRFEGFGEAAWNAHPPTFYAKRAEFFGLPVRLNEQIIPAVRCAEAEVARACADHPYTPRRLSGIRTTNTYHTGEVSNHVYGIALDIDPTLNTCCGCTAKWRAHPLCKREVSSIFERMSMPECWVTAFEKYGFYWLGHDTLQDTMHFEFLGEPERILAE